MHPRSLISTFIVLCLDSVMSLVSVTKSSSLMLASVAEQASLSLTWSETPEDTFSHDEAHINEMKCEHFPLFLKKNEHIEETTTISRQGVFAMRHDKIYRFYFHSKFDRLRHSIRGLITVNCYTKHRYKATNLFVFLKMPASSVTFCDVACESFVQCDVLLCYLSNVIRKPV